MPDTHAYEQVGPFFFTRVLWLRTAARRPPESALSPLVTGAALHTGDSLATEGILQVLSDSHEVPGSGVNSGSNICPPCLTVTALLIPRRLFGGPQSLTQGSCELSTHFRAGVSPWCKSPALLSPAMEGRAARSSKPGLQTTSPGMPHSSAVRAFPSLPPLTPPSRP